MAATATLAAFLVVKAIPSVATGSEKTKPAAGPAIDAKKAVAPPFGAAKLAAPLEGMVLLAGGAFTVGSGMEEFKEAKRLCGTEVLGDLCRDKDYPFGYELWVHTVYLDAFFLDRTEVTVAAYRRCVSAGDCLAPTFTTADPKFDRDDFPVTHVSYDDARKYCAYRGARLPTEAEWERAARGSAPRRFPWGQLPNPKLANHGALDTGSIFLPQTQEPFLGIPDPVDGFTGLAPIGSFPSGATPEGIHDLAGNVSEWVSDYWSDGYANAAAGNPQGPPSGTLRVIRGGSYRHPIAMVRGAARDRRPPSAREPTLGFRCARGGKAS